VSISAARFRYIMVAGSTAVVIGVGFTGVGLRQHANASASVGGAKSIDYTGGAAGPPAAGGGQITNPLGDPTAATSVPGVPSADATTPAPARTKPSSRPAPKPKRTKTTSTPRTSPARPPVTSGSILDQVLAHINAARAQAGLSAYALNNNLSKASALHNQLMIGGCGLSHQCAGEGGIGDRFSAQGVGWTSAGENIGYGSAGASNAEIIKAANGLTDSMLAEVAPNDGHKKNLLSSGFKHIGLSVTRDSKGLVWMTQDFVN
jgi:uncharacterized protein YkwD